MFDVVEVYSVVVEVEYCGIVRGVVDRPIGLHHKTATKTSVIIIFVDDNSLIDRYKAYLEKRELQKEKAKYEENIKKDQEFLDAIQSNPEELEKFAREEYKMKGKNEDVYIIKED